MSTDPADAPASSPHPTADPTVRRLRPLGETIFATMSRLAASTGAINLGQGYPDSDGPRVMLDEAIAAIERGENQYALGRAAVTLAGAEWTTASLVSGPDRKSVV